MIRRRARLVVVVVATVAAAVGLWLATGSGPKPQPASARYGVDQLQIRRSAGGHLLDLRYRVVDPERAASLLAKHAHAYVMHARTGMQLPVPSTPKAGALRTTGVPRAGRRYFALFANPSGLVRSGDHVSVVLGELTADLVVE